MFVLLIVLIVILWNFLEVKFQNASCGTNNYKAGLRQIDFESTAAQLRGLGHFVEHSLELQVFDFLFGLSFFFFDTRRT